MRGKWVLLSVSAVLLAIAAGALSRLRRGPVEEAAPGPKAVEAGPPPGEVSLSGTIQARHVIPVSAQVSGTVEAFLVDVGQEVYEGQLLARISNQGLEAAREMAAAAGENAQARVNKIEAEIIAARLEASRARADATRSRGEFERAEKAYNRQKLLHNEGATPRLVYEKSEREFNVAESEYRSLDELARQAEERVTALTGELQNAKKVLEERSKQIEEAQANLQAAEVPAPVNGVVVARKGEVGKQQDQSDPLFQIAVDLAALEVVLEPEPPVRQRIKGGRPALIFAADIPGEGIPGTVEEVTARQVKVAFTSPNPILKPGLTAQVRLKLD